MYRIFPYIGNGTLCCLVYYIYQIRSSFPIYLALHDCLLAVSLIYVISSCCLIFADCSHILCSAVLGVALYWLSADTDFLVLSFWDYFLCCFVTMFYQHCIVGVVWNVLRTTCCSYVSLFLYFQGNAFQVLCMYAPPHPVKKCVVLCVRGLLYFVDPSLGPSSPDAPFRNIVQRLWVPKLFAMLLNKFHVGLWSSITKLKLFPLLRHILPPTVMKTLCRSRKKPNKPK